MPFFHHRLRYSWCPNDPCVSTCITHSLLWDPSAVHIPVIALILTEWRYETVAISSGTESLFLHSCPTIQRKRPSCCSSLRCLLMMSVYGWEESSIWSRPLENKMSIKLHIVPEYQQIQFGYEGKSNRAIISTAVWCLWLMNALLWNVPLWSRMSRGECLNQPS